MNDKLLTHYDEMHSGANEKGKYTTHKRYFLTINNPLPIFSHEYIKKMLSRLNLKYYCMSDEVSESGTFHTHLYWESYNVIRWDTVKRMFHTAHIQPAWGTNTQCRNYLLKIEDYVHKAETSIENSFEEWGEFIPMRQGERSDWRIAKEMIQDGNGVMDVIDEISHMMQYDTTLDRYKQRWIEEQFKNTYRHLEVTYIQGKSRTGKTRHVMDKHGYGNVCKMNAYKKNPRFDKYNDCQDVLLLDEFENSFDIQEMLDYLDGYPLHLPSRYNDKFACYTKVYIVSNIPIEKQYLNDKKHYPDVYDAFIARIKNVMVFTGEYEYDLYSTDEYFKALKNNSLHQKQSGLLESADQEDLDFDDIEDIA